MIKKIRNCVSGALALVGAGAIVTGVLVLTFSGALRR
jgi:hypothetical protein